MDKQDTELDAGLASLDHYKKSLPTWRYVFRESLLRIVRAETPYVALLQERLRSPALDTYFAMTANLGTHTCFMIALPILFWCGNPFLGRALSMILAAGVYFSGFVKDCLCLPRPLSPPLTRITMSGSAALEYGFPSTHSTNAVSVAVFAVLLLRDNPDTIAPGLNPYLQGLAWVYAFSIAIGRLYCGMHGFLDVFWGSLLGAVIAYGQFYLGPARDEWLFAGGARPLIIDALIVCILVRIHPEPVDDCPCFDDSVAFAGVILGIDIGGWHFSQTQYRDFTATIPSTVPFSVHELGWAKVIARITVGVVVTFLWRATMKPSLLRLLPPIFRVVENLGLDLPRRYFKPASQYKKVPKQNEDDDNVIPSVRNIPNMLANLRHRRAASIGPQSEADVYEALAYRQKRRRESLQDLDGPTLRIKEEGKKEEASEHYFSGAAKFGSHSRKRSLSLEEFRAQMGASAHLSSPIAVTDAPATNSTADMEGERYKSELFANVQKPRVRYDVEVVTKLIVYSGIAWLAVEGNPILFHHVGLGLYK